MDDVVIRVKMNQSRKDKMAWEISGSSLDEPDEFEISDWLNEQIDNIFDELQEPPEDK